VTVAIAGLTLITTLVIAWRQHRRQQNAYLVLALKLEEVKDDHLVVHTSLDNRSELRKQIDAVQLIVCPYNEKPEHAAIKLRPDLAGRLKDMRDIASVDLKGPLPADPKTGDPLPGDGRVWLPLLYYTRRTTGLLTKSSLATRSSTSENSSQAGPTASGWCWSGPSGGFAPRGTTSCTTPFTGLASRYTAAFAGYFSCPAIKLLSLDTPSHLSPTSGCTASFISHLSVDNFSCRRPASGMRRRIA